MCRFKFVDHIMVSRCCIIRGLSNTTLTQHFGSRILPTEPLLSFDSVTLQTAQIE